MCFKMGVLNEKVTMDDNRGGLRKVPPACATLNCRSGRGRMRDTEGNATAYGRNVDEQECTFKGDLLDQNKWQTS